MAKTRIALKLSGFEDLLNEIERTGGTIKGATNQCMEESAKIMNDELKAKMQSSGVSSSLISHMDSPSVEWEGNRCKASVGFKKSSYEYNQDMTGVELSYGALAAILNYGTPKRFVKTAHVKAYFNGSWHTLEKGRGEITGKHFIETAKKTAKTKIKKQQEKTLNEILRGLRT